MREFGVRRYGDTLYHHCMADSAADAANWFAAGVRIKGVRNLPRPLMGSEKIAAFARRPSRPLETRECELNGLPRSSHCKRGAPSSPSSWR